MKKWYSFQSLSLLRIANAVLFVVLLNVAASHWNVRLDLTEDKRYSLKPYTRHFLENLEEDVFIEVFLDGDLNPAFKQFHNEIENILEEFSFYSHRKISYQFTDPSAATSENAKREFHQSLIRKGIVPLRLLDKREGKMTEQLIFPAALVSVGAAEKGISLLTGNRAGGSLQTIHQSIENLEYTFIQQLAQLTQPTQKKVNFLVGHGEADSLSTWSLTRALRHSFQVGKIDLTSTPSIANTDVLVVIKPKEKFSEADQYKIDQYVMRGGKILWLLDFLHEQDERGEKTIAPYETGVEDLLFKYGVRVNYNVLEDKVCGRFPVVTGDTEKQYAAIDFPFYPLITHVAPHLITRNSDAVLLKWASTMDTVKALNIRKTPLLFSSVDSRVVSLPYTFTVPDIVQLANIPFEKGPFVVGYLLEGSFSSAFAHRVLPEQANDFVAQGKPSKQIIISDANMGMNDYHPEPMPLGYDPISQYTFSNESLLVNMVSYLADENGIISLRNKDIKFRPLDKQKLQHKTKWQVITILLPVLFFVFVGLLLWFARRRRIKNL